MSSVDDRQRSAVAKNDRQREQSGPTGATGALQMPGLVTQLSPAEQLSFPQTTPFIAGNSTSSQFAPGVTRPLPNVGSASGVTRPLPPLTPLSPSSDAGATGKTGKLSLMSFATPAPPSAAVTRNLAEVDTGALLPVRTTSTTGTLRQTVVIRGSGTKHKGSLRPPKGRRWVIHITGTLVLLFIAFGTLLAVSPVGNAAEWSFNPFHSLFGSSQANSATLSLSSQMATVTAVTQDGHDTGSHTYAGLPTPPPVYAGNGGSDGFTYGQCTYWADYYYHELTGHWVPWGGDAWAWAGGARASGWVVSGSPHVYSIIVLQPYVQGAGGYGHVAVVVGMNSDGSVRTSNWNWYAGGGGWATTSYWNFFPGPGVSFVWYPGA